ncbi:MAG: SCO family protein [Proteobacteria bacterium]|nr:SCO family protein [Pseudomonadota bacterium]
METQRDRRPTLILTLGVTVLAIAAGVLGWIASQPARPDLAGTLLAQPRPLPAFSLVRHDGVPVTAAELRGHWSVLFFGFTHCPDVCPTTMLTLQQTMAAIEGPRPMVILVSLDPMRDTPDQLAPYVTYFDSEFVGFTGELADVQILADGLGVAYAYVPGEGDDYSVDHTASLFLIDPKGRLAALFHPPHDATALARDLQEIMR